MSLPSSMIEIAETLGLRVALRLMEAFGGQEMRVPKSPSPDHPIIKALGDEDGLALCRYAGGDMLHVPHGRARRSAREDILALEAKGMGRAEIARALGITQRHVRRAANGPMSDPRQPSLFGED